jgi:hypothetical protein
MNNRPRLWPRIAAALVIALAAGVTWGIVIAWSGYLATQLLQTSDSVYESIQVLDDGTPVIQTYSYATVVDQTYRTLDGKPVELEGRREEWLAGAYFLKPIQPSRVLEMPISWPERLAASSNFQRPQVGWYVVRDDQPLGRAYLVGYDEASRLRVGYIGRSGFRPALPPREDWFDVGRHRFGWSEGAVASSGNLQFGSRAYTYPQAAGDLNLPTWLLFLIDGDRLLEIDLRARSVRTLLEAPGMLAAAVVTEPPTSNEQTDAAEANSPATANTTAATTTVTTRRRREPPQQRVAIRMADRIIVLDPPAGAKREYVLPESLRERLINIFAVGDNQVLIHWWKHKDGFRGDVELTWLQPDGSIAREESVALAGPPPASERQGAWVAAVLAPVPIGWLAALSVVVPLGILQTNDVSTYADGLAKVFGFAWPPLVIVIVVGVMLAGLTYRLQRKYCRPGTGAWTTFVLLLGLPGFLAYWLEQCKPNLEVCSSCHAVVPRDRDACAACDAQFPAPPLVGTEIFA